MLEPRQVVNSGDPVVMFDGECSLCCGVVKFALGRDSGAFKFLPMQSHLGRQVLDSLGLDTESYESFVLVENGQFYRRSDAAIKLLEELTFPWRAAAKLLKLVPRPVRNLGYRLVSKSRYTVFGRRDSCMVPEENVKHRFLE